MTPPHQVRPIDWPRVLAEIAWCIGQEDRDGVRVPAGQKRLVRYLGIRRGTYRRWLDGAEPRHRDGEVLIAVWCSLTGKPTHLAPREPCPRSLIAPPTAAHPRVPIVYDEDD